MKKSKQLKEIKKEELRAGDVVLFPGHVGLYAPNPPKGKEGHTIFSAMKKGIGYGKSEWFSGEKSTKYYRILVPIEENKK